MKAMKASLLVRGLRMVSALCLVAAVASLAVAQSNAKEIGTWKLNLAKSTYSPGPPPKNLTLTFEADGQGLTVLAQGTDAEGKPINPDKNKGSVIFDGKEHPAPNNPAYDAAIYKRIAANTSEVTRKKAGKVVQTGTNTISKDGKVMTIRTKGVNASGQPIDNVAVYDKQ
jgi:hypothetical protein